MQSLEGVMTTELAIATQLGPNGKQITRVGFGTYAIGG